MTTILSASMMVLRRCATMMVVLPLLMAPNASCAAPLAVSRSEVQRQNRPGLYCMLTSAAGPCLRDLGSCLRDLLTHAVRLSLGETHAKIGRAERACIRRSVRLSRELVASSSSSRRGFFRMARANATRCFSPARIARTAGHTQHLRAVAWASSLYRFTRRIWDHETAVFGLNGKHPHACTLT